MRNLAAPIAALALVGCAMSAAELRDSSEVSARWTSTQPPAQAMQCIGTRLADASAMVSTQARPDSGELLVYNAGHLWALYHIRRTAAGTDITVRMQPSLLGFERERVVEPAKGC